MAVYEVHSQRLLDDGQRNQTVNGVFGPYEDLETAVRMAERQQEQGAVALQLVAVDDSFLIEQVWEGPELEELIARHAHPPAPLGPRARLSPLAAQPPSLPAPSDPRVSL